MPLQKTAGLIRARAAQYAPLQLDLLKRLTSVDSGTGNLEGNKQVVSILSKELAAFTSRVEYVDTPVGSHIVARLGDPAAKRRIILNAHTDSVFAPGEAAKHPFRMEGDRAYGLGIVDCKGGVVVSMYAARIAHELGLIPPDVRVTMLYNCDEETGSAHSIETFKKEGANAEFIFVFEPGRGENGAVTSRRGRASGIIEVTGKEAHSGLAYTPDEDAVLELARMVTSLAAKSVPEKNIYFRVSEIRTGRGANPAPGTAHAEFGMSFSSQEEMLYVTEAAQSLEKEPHAPGCTVRVRLTSLSPAMEKTEGNTRAYLQVKKAADLLGRHFPEQFSTGSSDACFFSSLGLPTVDALGPYMYDIHTVNESLKTVTIRERTELFALTLALL